jgi:hypothetical protein
MRDSGGTGFWHETYCMRGGIEAIYDDLASADSGLIAFAPRIPARSGTFSSRRRLQRSGQEIAPPDGTLESELHGNT